MTDKGAIASDFRFSQEWENIVDQISRGDHQGAKSALAERDRRIEEAIRDSVSPQIVTSTTRPADPLIGDRIHEWDTGAQYYWTGTAWRVIHLPWADYTPAIVSMTNHTVTHARWTQHYDTVTVSIYLQCNAGYSGNLWVGMPKQSSLQGFSHVGQSANAWDASTGTSYPIWCKFEPTNYLTFRRYAGSGIVHGGAPFTWATGDVLGIASLNYEVDVW